MKKKRVGFFSGLDFVTFITALIGSCYGLALVYSATYSTLMNGAIIASGVKRLLPNLENLRLVLFLELKAVQQAADILR